MVKTPQRQAAGKTRAIVLIPGLRRDERNFRRKVLTDNMVAVVQDRHLELGEVKQIQGESGQSLRARELRGGEDAKHAGPREIDVFEAHWTDMVPDPTEVGPWRKLLNGLDLLAYWLLRPSSWRAFHVSPMIAVGLGLGALLLVLWYVSLVMVVAQAVSQAGLPPEWERIEWIKAAFDGFIGLAERIGGWQLWLVTAALLGFVKVDQIVGVARFTKDYCENRVLGGEEEQCLVGLRDRLRERVVVTLNHVLAKQPKYDEVFVVAHSFGTVIAVDTLRDWPHAADFERLKLVTLGSPLAVLRFRSKSLSDELDGLLQEGRLRWWTDYSAATDWLCAAIPGHADRFAGQSHKLNFEAPFSQRFLGGTHFFYYQNQDVLTELASGACAPTARARPQAAASPESER